MRSRSISIIIGALWLGMCYVKAQTDPFYMDAQQKKWVDSLYSTMSLDQKIGQLFMVAAYSNRDQKHQNEILQLIAQQQIGGLIFMQDDPLKQAQLTNLYQEASATPLFIGIDGEWGLNMRLKNTYRFPWNMTLGAIQNDDYIYQMGAQMAKHCKRIGIHMNFAPDVDVNVNPLNPIIGNRSFGSDVLNVTRKGEAIAKGMQDNGVIASAKHFPGHGDTHVDSHASTPVIQHSRTYLDSVDLYPFKQLAKRNVGSIMVGHLNVPALEPNPNLPASISPNVIQHLLLDEWHYQGLVITDALNMKGLTNLYPDGETDLRAFLAGNDILLFSEAVQVGKTKIKKALESGQINIARLERSIKKILSAKYFVGLNNYQPINLDNLITDLNDHPSELLHERLIEEAVTVLCCDYQSLPIQDLKNKRFAYVALEEEGYNPVFYTYLKKYAPFENIEIKSQADIVKLENFDYVVIGVHKSNKNPWKSYKINPEVKTIIHQIAIKHKTIVSVFASPYSLLDLEIDQIEGLILGYQNSEISNRTVPQIIFGALPAKGKLPVTLNDSFPAGSGIMTEALGRLSYGSPEKAQMSSKKLAAIDSLAEEALRIGATPGMQILVARRGTVLYEKSFGYQSSDKKRKVGNDDLYDIASITKITATLPMIFKLKDEGVINYDEKIGNYMHSTRGTNKANLSLREILAHQAGLESWIPFYKNTFDTILQQPSHHYYRYAMQQGFHTPVAHDLYLKDSYKKVMLDSIFRSKLGPKQYLYSDLGYYLMKNFIEKKRDMTLDKILDEEFYSSMGAYTLTYNPLKKYKKERIAPTEDDQYFRNQLIRGYVHDQGAAMLGGVAGHAGLFARANDLAKMMQMYLQDGFYGGKQYIQTETIKEATQYQYPQNDNRRGLGFDKKQFKKGTGSACDSASANSFGHSGFTGTLAWVDPDKELVYVFLSNRVNPSASNKLLIKKNIRTKIMQAIYDAIEEDPARSIH